MQRKSLFSRYFTMCLMIIMSSMLVLGLVLLLLSTQYFKTDRLQILERNAREAASITAEVYAMSAGQYLDVRTVQSNFQILAEAFEADIFFVDASGKTLVCTDEGSCNHSTYLLDRTILSQALSRGYRELGRLGGLYPEPRYTVGVPVAYQGMYIGAVFASCSAAGLYIYLGEVFKMFLLGALLVMLVASVIIYFSTERLVSPLRGMVRAAESFAKGDFTVRVPVEGYDEVVRLARAFNDMASSLATLEGARRSFVANVSHELKTPMTTIGGFIDGILDGTIPPEQQPHYLGIVSQEVKRLSRLVVSMLGIARIEAGEMTLKPAPVDVNEIVCRTVFTFERQIEDKHLEIRGLDAGKVMAQADSDLVHQVVYNLIENAVKFTPEGGYIALRYETRGGMVYTGVKNSGEGIEKEEIPKLFDRFYKTDKSRSVDKKGVGLGLYIVRTLVNLQGGEITVKSAQGEYSEFIFSLPVVPKSSSLFKKAERPEKETQPSEG